MAQLVKTIPLRTASLTVALGIIFSRLLGLVREILMAHWVGAGKVTDAFFVAFRIPNTLRNLIAEGGMTAAVSPVYSDLLPHPERRQAFERRLFSLVRIFLLLLALSGILLAPLWVRAFALGLSGDTFALAVRMNRWLFPMVYFLGLIGVAMAILQVRGKFFLAAAGPVFMNLGLILGTWLYTQPIALPGLPSDALCVGALLGAALHWYSQYLGLRSSGVTMGWEFLLNDPYLKNVLAFMAPATAGFAVYQVSIMLSTQFASLIPLGGVSHLNYGDRLVQLPLALIGTATGSVSLALFSQHRHDSEKLKVALSESLLFVTFLALPSLTYLAIFSYPLVELLYAHGAYPRSEITRTVAAIYGYLPGIFFASFQRILLALYFAKLDRRTPLITSLFGLMAQGIGSYLLLPWDTLGVALGSSLGTCMSTLALYRMLKQRGLEPERFWISGFLKAALSSGVAALLGIWVRGLAAPPYLVVVLGLFAMGGAYLLATLLLGHPEALRYLWRGRNKGES